jgi:hypothetical protein
LNYDAYLKSRLASHFSSHSVAGSQDPNKKSKHSLLKSYDNLRITKFDLLQMCELNPSARALVEFLGSQRVRAKRQAQMVRQINQEYLSHQNRVSKESEVQSQRSELKRVRAQKLKQLAELKRELKNKQIQL